MPVLLLYRNQSTALRCKAFHRFLNADNTDLKIPVNTCLKRVVFDRRIIILINYCIDSSKMLIGSNFTKIEIELSD